MANFHLTEQGPRLCSTTQERCPVTRETGGEHYDSMADAQGAFEASQGTGYLGGVNQPRERTFAPPMPPLEHPTLGEVEELLERSRRYIGGHRHTYRGMPPVALAPVVGFGLTGSGLYGLNTPDSDRDITIITAAPSGDDFHHVFDDGADVRLTSVFRMADRVLWGTPPDVDLLSSGMLSMADDRYRPYYNSLRFDRFNYLDKLGRHSRAEVRNSLEDSRNPKRSAKSLKTALRNAVIHGRVLNHFDGMVVRTRFTPQERENFYRELHHLDRTIAARKPGPDEAFDILWATAERVDS